MIDRFGVLAIMGRPTLWAHEAYQMRIAETIYNGYAMRVRATNWAAFQTENPELSELLVEAQKLAEG